MLAEVLVTLDFFPSFLFLTFLTLTNKRYIIATVKIKTIHLHLQLHG